MITIQEYRRIITGVRLEWLNSLHIDDEAHVLFEVETKTEVDDDAKSTIPDWVHVKEVRQFLTVVDGEKTYAQAFRLDGEVWVIDDEYEIAGHAKEPLQG